MVRYLLAHRSSLDAQDDNGHTPLHYATFSNQPDRIELLLKSGASIDMVSFAMCSALHVAVNNNHVDCVKVLLKHGCNVNLQDFCGDSALHDAVRNESIEIIDLLINVPEIDFNLKNNEGFNVLHYAALKGKNAAIERLIAKSEQIVNGKKDDGFAALHIAALNGHFNVAETLLQQGHSEIEIRTNIAQTPLLLAVSQCHCALIERLVSAGADVNVKDEEGNTGLHLALMNKRIGKDTNLENAPMISCILSQLLSITMENNLSLAVACYLAKEGANLSETNMRGETPLQLAAVSVVQDLLRNYSYFKHPVFFSSAQAQSFVPVDGGQEFPYVECKICCEAPGTVTFEPCGHRVVCEDCSLRMKKCITCQKIIEKKTTLSGEVLPSNGPQFSVKRMQYLESAVQEMGEIKCSICMDKRKNIAFTCGHCACNTCAKNLKMCHMCRKPIHRRIKLY